MSSTATRRPPSCSVNVTESLAASDLGTAHCYGAVADSPARRYWLFLEHSAGRRALADRRAHGLAGGRPLAGTAAHELPRCVSAALLRYDRSFYETWLVRARTRVGCHGSMAWRPGTTPSSEAARAPDDVHPRRALPVERARRDRARENPCLPHRLGDGRHRPWPARRRRGDGGRLEQSGTTRDRLRLQRRAPRSPLHLRQTPSWKRSSAAVCASP